jgi:hypothetical protein
MSQFFFAFIRLIVKYLEICRHMFQLIEGHCAQCCALTMLPHACIWTRICHTLAPPRTNCKHTALHARTYIHIQARTFTIITIKIRTHTHTHEFECMRVHTSHTHVHTRTHTYTHTHTHTHMSTSTLTTCTGGVCTFGPASTPQANASSTTALRYAARTSSRVWATL